MREAENELFAATVETKRSAETGEGCSLPTSSVITCPGFYSGAVLRGTQRSGRNTYPVEVNLAYVDLESCFLCGYLKISGLTDEYPVLVTYFDAEIVDTKKHHFLTKKWEADEQVDRQHWSKFPAFEPYARDFHKGGFSVDFENQDYIFMRWKEHFLVPDHRVTAIQGASFAGFYYICCDKRTLTVSGLYFHQSSEMFQSLHLHHAPQKTFGSFEFR